MVMVTCLISHVPTQYSDRGGHNPIRPASNVMWWRPERLDPISIEPGRNVIAKICSSFRFKYGSSTGPRVSNATFIVVILLLGIRCFVSGKEFQRIRPNIAAL